MTKEDKGHFRAYKTIDYSPERLRLLGIAAQIINEHEDQGLTLSVRQLYYQFVTMNLIENKKASYSIIQNLINDGRMTGHISWLAIEDRGRNLRGLRSYESPAQAIKETALGYRRDLWATQPFRPEVWIEKDALVGVIGSICNSLRVDFYSQRGYNSSSEQWRAGQRFASYITKGQRPIVFHLGDHDPSGLDMTRSNRERLELFAGVPIIVQRLALSFTQVDQYRLPPNPAKESDARFKDYEAQYGNESWELDALHSKVIQDLIFDAVVKIRDEDAWNEALLQETEEKRYLQELSET